jgi:uncharacterized protein (TIGR03435 family)
MAEFARGLSGVADIGRRMIDRTGLAGNWDAELMFTPERLPRQPPGEEP